MSNEPHGTPSLSAYSESATRKQVITETAQHPATLLPMALGVLGGIGVLALTPLSAAVGVGLIVSGVAAGTAGWVFNYKVRGNSLALRYHRKLHERFEIARQQKLEVLKQELDRVGCEHGERQVQQFNEKFDNLSTVLGRKLDSLELTYSRFLSTAEIVYQSGLKNLEQVAIFLQSISEIRIADLRRRIAKLGNPQTAATQRELAALTEREKIYASTMERVEDLLAQNEEALTIIDNTAVAISAIGTPSITGSTEDMEGAMQDLVRLAKRVGPSDFTLASVQTAT